MNKAIKRLLFYWITSFILATILYYILWVIMPEHYVFGALYRMFLYHWEYPISFIVIPCFFYGVIATLFAETFLKQKVTKQILLTFLIIIITILLSSPFGGMLWHYYDMKAGYFPSNWILKILKLGFEWRLGTGWVIIILYNIIGSIACFFWQRKEANYLKPKK